MRSFTPYYIILGEFGIAIALSVLARTLRSGSWRSGVAAGLAIFVCYAASFALADGLAAARR
jgi:hypothetical protein